LEKKKSDLMQFQKETENHALWANPAKAQTLMKQISELKDEVESWQELQHRVQDAVELASLNDEHLETELQSEISEIESELQKREIDVLLNGPYDRGNAILEISSGAGGTESQDWAQMLERMYLRWAERHKFKTEIWDRSEGEEAGIKSVTIYVSGQFAYGYLHAEKGVHRLVRLSPFDANHRRHTSFAKVEVLPEVTQEDPVVQIDPADLKSTSTARQVLGDKMCKKTQPRSGSPIFPRVL